MEAKPQELREYTTAEGKSPFGSWLRSVKDISARAKIRVRLNRLRIGNFGDCKSVGGGVRELKIDLGPGYRVYFGQDGSVIVILLCGGTKSSQSKDIAQAQEYWQNYKERRDE